MSDPAGSYRHRVSLEGPGPAVPDGDGGYTEGWAPLDPPEIDASIQAANARDLERVTAGTVLTTATHLIRARFHPGITTQSRITFKGRRFEVQSVQNVDERDVALILICAEVVGESLSTRAAPPSATVPASDWA